MTTKNKPKRRRVPDDTAIAEMVRTALAESGVTRYRLAQISGIAERHVGRILDGENVPRLDSAAKLLAAIGLRLSIDPITPR